VVIAGSRRARNLVCTPYLDFGGNFVGLGRRAKSDGILRALPFLSQADGQEAFTVKAAPEVDIICGAEMVAKILIPKPGGTVPHGIRVTLHPRNLFLVTIWIFSFEGPSIGLARCANWLVLAVKFEIGAKKMGGKGE